MSEGVNRYIEDKLLERQQQGILRSLKQENALIDFCSNDYLGLAKDPELYEMIENEIADQGLMRNGSTGSRLLTGNSAYAMQLENEIAAFHQTEASLLFNSGYDANYGLLSALPYRNHTILFDELVHASILDGIQKSKANALPFKHNDVADLHDKIKTATDLVFVVIESVYSMDGDLAPLKEIADMCAIHNASLIVDEAHATGLYGPKGEGRVVQEGLSNKVFARVHTYGKAFGVHGASIVGSKNLIRFLVNFARPFVYSTAMPPHSLASIRCAYRYMYKCDKKRIALHENIRLFKEKLSDDAALHWSFGEGAIQTLIVPGNEPVKTITAELNNAGFDVRPILYPTVPLGKERIRICLHSFNTAQEVLKLTQAIQHVETSITF